MFLDARQTRPCLRAQTRVFLAMSDWDKLNYRRDRSWIRDWPERNHGRQAYAAPGSH